MELLKYVVLLCFFFQLISFISGKRIFEEPVCSKFHFEENLLEKVVRFEIKLESMQSMLDTLAEQILAEQDKLNTDKTLLLQDTQKFKDDVAGDIRDMKTNLETLETRQTDVDGRVDRLLETTEGHVARMSRDVHTLLNKTVAEIMDAANVPPVAFTAHQLYNLSAALAAGETLVFTEVELNEGGGYDRSTGRFTAPVTGVYMFTVQMCLFEHICIRIVDGDGGVLNAAQMSISKPYYGCSSEIAVASLKQTETVMAQIVFARPSGTIVEDSSTGQSVFSRVLIHNHS